MVIETGMIRIINCQGLLCPQPVINTKKYFDSIDKGSAVVVVDNEIAKENIIRFCETNKLRYEFKEKEKLFEIEIIKDGKSYETDKTEKTLIVVITSDRLGEGDAELGSTLMKSYIYALSENDKLPEEVIFLNSGVKLTTEGSRVIEIILKLQEKGVRISSCGTCLDFYDIKDKLLVGEVTNMYTIVEKMTKSDKTIKL